MLDILRSLRFNEASAYAGGSLKALGMPESYLHGFISDDGTRIEHLDITIVERTPEGGRALLNKFYEAFAALGIVMVDGVASKVGSSAWAQDPKYRFDATNLKITTEFIQRLQIRIEEMEALFANKSGHDGLKKDLTDFKQMLAAPTLDPELPQMAYALSTRTLPKLLVPAIRQLGAISKSSYFQQVKDPDLRHYLLLDNQWAFTVDLKPLALKTR